METSEERRCLFCGSALEGRSDQKYCDSSCRTAYHGDLRKKREEPVRRINKTLKRNWNILRELNVDGKTRIDGIHLKARFFDFRYFTSIYRTQGGNVYYYCYDQGYLDIGSGKYLLVRKQG